LLDIKQRTGAVFFIAIVAQVILVSVQVQTKTGVRAIEAVSFGAFARVQVATSSFVRGVGDVWTNYGALRGARDENTALKRQIGELDVRLQEQRALAGRTTRLQELLGLQQTTPLQTIAADLSRTAGAQVEVRVGLPPFLQADEHGVCIDAFDISIDDYGPPNARHLLTHDDAIADEHLYSQLLKSNCPVTAQPDWASLHLHYRGPRIDRMGLLRYLLSFRNHAEFHEQCVERIFVDILQRCRPQRLSVQARYTRRGGLDINPWRATAGTPVPVAARDQRQ